MPFIYIYTHNDMIKFHFKITSVMNYYLAFQSETK